MWGLWWTKRHWGRFSPSTSVSPANHSTDFSIIIITWGWHSRPFSGRSVEWTLIPPPTIQIKKKKGKVVPMHHTMKTYCGEGECRYSFTILDLGTRWSASRPGGPRYPMDRRLGGPQSRSRRCGDEKNLFPLLGMEPRPSNPNPSLHRRNHVVVNLVSSG
jgi:hypothetical protein